MNNQVAWCGRRHLHHGFSARDNGPLAEALGEQYCVSLTVKDPSRRSLQHSQQSRDMKMPRPLSRIAPGWWDYTTLDAAIISDAARLSPRAIEQLSRPGFRVVFYETLQDFYLAEALEYIVAWRGATADDPVGVCGPIGPTEQLPLVARLVNELGLDLRHAHFWGMDEWYENGREVPVSHPLSFERADRELCFDRIRPELRMPEENLHFPKSNTTAYTASWNAARCAVMQGGQGDTKHWAFNDPPRRIGRIPARTADAEGVSQPWLSGGRSSSGDPRRTPAPVAEATSGWFQCRRSRLARARRGVPRRYRSGTLAFTTTRLGSG